MKNIITDEYIEGVRKECLGNLLIDKIYDHDTPSNEIPERKIVNQYYNAAYSHEFVFTSCNIKCQDNLIRTNAHYLCLQAQKDIDELKFNEMFVRDFGLNVFIPYAKPYFLCKICIRVSFLICHDNENTELVELR